MSNDHDANDPSYVHILFADFQEMGSAFGILIAKKGLHNQTRIAKQLQNDRSIELAIQEEVQSAYHFTIIATLAFTDLDSATRCR